jgi:predicted deacetylase
MKEEPIKPTSYTKEYFLKNNSGWLEWSQGQRDAGRFGFMFQQANIKQGDRVLELGCGRGELGYLCAKAGADVTMVDFSPEAIELAKETMKEFPRTKFICCDVKEFPINKYDHTFALELFEHLHQWELQEVIKRVKECGSNFWIHTSPEKNWGLKNIPETMGDRQRHINCHTKESLQELFKGWELEFIPHSEMDLCARAYINPIYFNLSIDDVSPINYWEESLPWLLRLMRDYPQMKVSLFVIPQYKGAKISDYPKWLEMLKELPKENFELCLHGFTHEAQEKGKGRNDWAEFELIDKNEAIQRLNWAESEMEKSGLEHAKIFKAPCWYLSDEARKGIIEKGYKIVQIVGKQQDGDIVSGQLRPYCIYATHISSSDKNTNYLNDRVYKAVTNIINLTRDIKFKFLSEI